MLNKIRSFFNASIKDDLLNEDAICKLHNLKISIEEYEICKRKQSISQIKNYFSDQDNRNQFIPDGVPFQGEFDYYFDVKKKGKFYGFYRISVLPENKLEIHCGFTCFNSFLARRYLQITEQILIDLQDIFTKHTICSECLTVHENANNYLSYFNFELISSKDGINSYVLNKVKFKKRFYST
tara:strand:- start:504 stop:1049 length:546 start_codon:yes stop_codon:yes gene_type:complete